MNSIDYIRELQAAKQRLAEAARVYRRAMARVISLEQQQAILWSAQVDDWGAVTKSGRDAANEALEKHAKGKLGLK